MAKLYDIDQYKTKPDSSVINKLKKNKMLYFELSEEEKYDYDILKQIFTMFEKDGKFLEIVYYDIVKNVKQEWILEFEIRMLDIINQYSQEDYIKRYIRNPIPTLTKSILKESINFSIYVTENEILNGIEEILSNGECPELGIGFSIIEFQFYYSETIKNHFAKQFISKIFLELDLEKNLHENYSSFEEFESKNSIKFFIINYISSIDNSLGCYIINHNEIIEEVMDVFQYVKRTWQAYNNRESICTYEIIGNQIADYIKEHGNQNIDTIEQLWNTAYYVLYHFGVLDDAFPYIVGFDNEYLEIVKRDCRQHSLQQPNMIEAKAIKYYKSIISNALCAITDKEHIKIIKAEQEKIKKGTN